PLNVFDALSLQPERGARLGAGRNFNVGFAGQRGDFNLGPQRRLHKADRHLANQIVAITLENLVRLDVKNNIQVAGWSAAHACLAVPRGAKPRSGIHTGWNPQFDLRSPLVPTGSLARLARLFDDPSGAFTTGTGLGNAENASRTDDLPAPAARRKGLALGAALRP